MILSFDIALRLIAMGASFALLLAIVSSNATRMIKLILTGVIVGGICYLLLTSGMRPPFPWALPFDFVSLLTPFWTWLFARQMFDRMPEQRNVIAMAIAYCLFWCIAILPHAMLYMVGFFGIHILSVLLIIDIIFVSVAGRSDDLIEQRRTIRIWMPLLVGLFAAGVLLVEIFYWPDHSNIPDALKLIVPVNILLLVLLAVVAFLRTEEALIPAPLPSEPAAPAGNGLSMAESLLRDRLLRWAESGQYREPGLTIAGLAAQLDAPEHRLRALINQRLGYRNFSAFLNHHRIGEARAKLTDPQVAHIPILTIAMDLGYNSLATFNRAFRSETGQSPSEFRGGIATDS